MAIDRDAIMNALRARLVASLGSQIKSSDRRWLSWEDIPSSKQPALLVLGRSGAMAYEPGLPAKNTIGAWVVFYARPQLETDVVETLLFNLMKGVETALQKQDSETSAMPDDDGTTLGGFVYQCRITSYQLHLEMGVEQCAVSMTIDMLAV